MVSHRKRKSSDLLHLSAANPPIHQSTNLKKSYREHTLQQFHPTTRQVSRNPDKLSQVLFRTQIRNVIRANQEEHHSHKSKTQQNRPVPPNPTKISQIQGSPTNQKVTTNRTHKPKTPRNRPSCSTTLKFVTPNRKKAQKQKQKAKSRQEVPNFQDPCIPLRHRSCTAEIEAKAVKQREKKIETSSDSWVP
ncbi:hypothetical protein H6P81_012000 [Aristolochia fimbriata]|uniref:Uncharacterized protein n=1 Tax=Aristolochia fimbriata TaxID=158543 RepID=A0AAV7EEA7_ARIFI|nr:hypothetical protein H6P81_012000 [Aristolochia fimbriata]